MIKRYRYRAYPTLEQGRYFQQIFGACRFAYNWALALKIKSYEDEKAAGATKPRGLSIFDISKHLTELKKDPDHAWLNDVPAVALNWSLQHLDTAYKNFFRNVKNGGAPGFPKFKARGRSQKAFSYHQGYTLSAAAQTITVPKVKQPLKVIMHRHFKGDYKTATIIQEPSGKYYLSVVVDDHTAPANPLPLNEKQMVGLDVGVINTLTLSDGYQYRLNMEFERDEKRMLKAQRNLSRKTLKSNNWAKQKIKLARAHEKLRHKRKHAIENACVHLVTHLQEQGCTTLALRKYYVKAMVDRTKVQKEEAADGQPAKAKKGHRYVQRKVNKKIMGGALGMLCEQIKQKLAQNGINIVEFDANATKTTEKCYVCAGEDVEINLKSRYMNCNSCGHFADMDHNAARNVLAYGRQVLVQPELKKAKKKAKPGKDPV